jgi:hypothetical protein
VVARAERVDLGVAHDANDLDGCPDRCAAGEFVEPAAEPPVGLREVGDRD